MNKDREQAVILRQGGMTYSEIKERLGVPRSTLSSWFKGQNWSNTIATQNAAKARNSAAVRLVVLNTVRAGRLKKVYEDARQDAFADFHELKYHPLFLAAISLYWAHGDKTSKGRVSVSTSDPRVLRIFALFLRKICGMPKTRAQLMLKGDFYREEEIRAHWIEKAALSHVTFLKSVHIKPNKPVAKGYYGVCNLMVNSAYLKNKILRWIELLAEDIGQENYQIDQAGIV